MSMISFRCYGELNDFLPAVHRHRLFTLFCDDGMPVKDVIDNLRIPLDEVVLVLADNQPVDFDYVPASHERISIFPLFRTIVPP